MKLKFNSGPSTIMHIDLNSAFATIEQQANPFLRGRPVVVAAYVSEGGCILAASVEAKKLGIKTGMRVREAKAVCPKLIVLASDPDKYRWVHKALRKILKDYTDKFVAKSIDEFVLDLGGYPAIKIAGSMHELAKQIKERIRQEIGEWLTVSIGIAPNRFLAKTASGLHKPDGLDEINKKNFLQIYESLELTDLCGINIANQFRLNSVGIYDVVDFYNATADRLKAAFRSVLASYWYMRLRGWEVDATEFEKRSFGNSYAQPYSKGNLEELLPILQKLAEKTGSRLRHAGYSAYGVHLALLFRSGGYWQKREKFENAIFDSRDIFKKASKILHTCPKLMPVHTLAVSCFALTKRDNLQLGIFEDSIKKKNLVEAVDSVNEKWGDFIVQPAGLLKLKHQIHDRIAFGSSC